MTHVTTAIDNAIDNIYGGPEHALRLLVNRETAQKSGESQVWDRAYDRALNDHINDCWQTGTETERFVVEPAPSGRYKVLDVSENRYLRFGYNNPPLYETADKPATEWPNYSSARGFCFKFLAILKRAH